MAHQRTEADRIAAALRDHQPDPDRYAQPRANGGSDAYYNATVTYPVTDEWFRGQERNRADIERAIMEARRDEPL